MLELNAQPEDLPRRFGAIEKIISGGQTGVDRGALEAAIALGLAHGGWCPLGRFAEDGRIPERYLLQETESSEYSLRTERNVLDSCGTLLLYKQRLQKGSLLTYRLARKHRKPALAVRLDLPIELAEIEQWLVEARVRVLNVAGPRGSSYPEIAAQTKELLLKLFNRPRQIGLFE